MKIDEKLKQQVTKYLSEPQTKEQEANKKGEELLDNFQKEKTEYFYKTVGKNGISTDLQRVTDEDIKTLADIYYEGKISERKNANKISYDSKINSANDDFVSKENSIAEKVNDVETKLKSDIVNANEKSMRNNVAHSSIVAGQKEELLDNAKMQKQELDTQMQEAEKSRDNKIDNATNEFNYKNYRVDYDYAKPLADKQNELQGLKDSNSSYAKSLVNITARKEYDNKLLTLAENYVNEVGAEYAAKVLKDNNFFEKYLSVDQINYLKKKFNI